MHRTNAADAELQVAVNLGVGPSLHGEELRLAEVLDDDSQVVLLGSVASGKYVDILAPIFGARLLFPAIFAGLGDMSRGGLLLRAARANRELDYTSLAAPRWRSDAGDPVELARAWARSVSSPMGPKRT